MNIGETNPELRRIFLAIYIADGSALATDADVSPPSGALQVSLNGAAFVDAGGTLTHIGVGSYYYEASVLEVATGGFLAFKFSRTGYRLEFAWTTVGDTFTVDETDTTMLRMPMVIYGSDEPPTPATGATIAVSGDLQESTNGNLFIVRPGRTMPEVGSGLYYYQGASADVAVDVVGAQGGTMLVKYQSTGFRLSISTQVIFASTADPDTEEPAPGPEPIPVTDTIGTFIAPIDLVARALDRVVEFLR